MAKPRRSSMISAISAPVTVHRTLAGQKERKSAEISCCENRYQGSSDLCPGCRTRLLLSATRLLWLAPEHPSDTWPTWRNTGRAKLLGLTLTALIRSHNNGARARAIVTLRKRMCGAKGPFTTFTIVTRRATITLHLGFNPSACPYVSRITGLVSSHASRLAQPPWPMILSSVLDRPKRRRSSFLI